MNRRSTASLSFLQNAQFQLIDNSQEGDHYNDPYNRSRNVLVHSNAYSKLFLSLTNSNNLSVIAHDKLEALFDGGDSEQVINLGENPQIFENSFEFESKITSILLSNSENFISILTQQNLYIFHLASMLCIKDNFNCNLSIFSTKTIENIDNFFLEWSPIEDILLILIQKETLKIVNPMKGSLDNVIDLTSKLSLIIDSVCWSKYAKNQLLISYENNLKLISFDNKDNSAEELKICKELVPTSGDNIGKF